MNAIMKFLKDEEGATAVEYGLLAALIAGAIIAVVIDLGETLCGVFDSLETAIRTGADYTYVACA